MTFELFDLLSYSIVPAVLIGIIRWRHLHQAWTPFILLLLLGLANEVIGSVIIRLGYHNVMANNIYVLAESLLLTWFFNNVKTFKEGSRMAYIIGASFIIVWFADTLIFQTQQFNSYFVIFYATVIVLTSIGRINRFMVEYKGRLATNGLFLVLIAFIAYYSYSLLVEIFWLYGLGVSTSFQRKILHIHTYVNVIVNFTYAIALLCLPKKHVY